MDKNHLYREIDRALYATYYGISRIEDEELKKSRFHDLTVKELHAIDVITLHGTPTLSEVAKRIHLSRATITSTSDRLVRKGYAKRLRDDHDRRLVRLRLTDKGRLLNRAYRAYHNQMARSFLKNLNEQELQTIYHAFKNLEKFVNSH